MANVTYLIGAGASYDAVPIIKYLPNELKSFHSFLQSNRNLVDNDLFQKETGLNVNISDIEEEVLQFCSKLNEEVLRHASIDTYAKKLRLLAGNNNDVVLGEYKKLKAVLSGFFTLVQLQQPVDNRYDTFFASILKDSSYEFPNNLNILSWNYDFQFEKAFTEYSTNRKKDLKSLQGELNVIPRDSFRRSMTNNKFGILKINGTAGYYQKYKREYFLLAVDPVKSDKIFFLKNFYTHYALQLHKPEEGYSLLSFAWESGWHDFNVEAAIEEATKETDVFVIIGYSFPFFNREVDSKIFKTSSFNKIYVQDVNPEMVIQNMQLVLPAREVNIITKPIDKSRGQNVQFFIPPEL